MAHAGRTQKYKIKGDIMQIIEKNIDELTPYENNPRKNDKAVDYVANSINEFGFKVPIVIDGNGVIIAGHTRYKAAVKLKMDTVPCIVADDLTEKQIKAFRIADNKTSDFSIFDNKLLLEELESIGEIFTGFEIEEIEKLEMLDEKEFEKNFDFCDIMTYEITFKSENIQKIEKIKQIWSELDE